MKERVFGRAREIAERVKIYRAFSRDFPYRKEMEFSLIEELRRFDAFLSNCGDARFAGEARAAMRVFIGRTARVAAKTTIVVA